MKDECDLPKNFKSLRINNNITIFVLIWGLYLVLFYSIKLNIYCLMYVKQINIYLAYIHIINVNS